MLINLRNAMMTGKSWKNPYVTDGLVAMWDGEWNVGGGVHNATPAKWVDISGNGYDADLSNLVGTGSLVFEGKSVLKSGYISYPAMDTGITLSDGIHSIESCMHFIAKESQNRHSGVGIYPVAIIMNRNVILTGMFSSASHHYRIGWRSEFTTGSVFDRGTYSHIQLGFSSQPTDSAKTLVYWNGSKVIGWTGGWSGSTTLSLRVSPCFSNESAASPAPTGVQRIYNIRVYSRALTAEEVAANYAVDKARFNLPDAT